LAGTLGILFCIDFCPQRFRVLLAANQIARGSLDRVCFVDLSDFARLGQPALEPNDEQLLSRVEKRIESAQIRELCAQFAIARGCSVSRTVVAFAFRSCTGPASPEVAGSSHESLNGIEDSERDFFLSEDLQQARGFSRNNAEMAWVFAYDPKEWSELAPS